MRGWRPLQLDGVGVAKDSDKLYPSAGLGALQHGPCAAPRASTAAATPNFDFFFHLTAADSHLITHRPLPFSVLIIALPGFYLHLSSASQPPSRVITTMSVTAFRLQSLIEFKNVLRGRTDEAKSENMEPIPEQEARRFIDFMTACKEKCTKDSVQV